MGRIKKVAGPKHEATISPALSSFVQKSLDTPLAELPTHLSTFPRRWPFPRGDLYHWIGVLNRFDDILALVIEKYALNNGPQVKAFGRLVLLESYSSSDGDNNEAKLSQLGFGLEGDRELVEAILDFSKLLLDKCGNRSLFSSSERLSDLLNTTSLSLLQCTLRFGVCLAQRYHSRQRSTSSSHFHQSLLAAHYNIDLDKVQALAAPFVKPSQSSKSSAPSSPAASLKGKEKALQGTSGRQGSSSKSNPNDLILLTRDGTEANGNTSGASSLHGANQGWDDWGHVRISYYPPTTTDQAKTGVLEGGNSGSHTQAHAPLTPSPASRGPTRLSRVSSSDESPAALVHSPAGKAEEALRGMKILEIPNSKIASSKIEQLLESNLSELPYESIYELLHKLRVAKGLTASPETRRQVLSIRILAITNLAYIYPDNIFQQKILQQDSDEPKRLQIAYQLAELVHLGVSGDINAPTSIQIFALNALDSLAKQKSRSGDVCAALNVNVNHGILMFIIRKAVADLGIEDDPKDGVEADDWRDALFALLRTLPGSSTRTPETLVSAGLIPMLVEVLNLRTEKARRVYPRVMEFLDTFVHAVRDALTTLANAKGFDAISDLISSETQSAFDNVSQGGGMPADYKTPTIDYQIAYFQQQTLRWLFKFVNHIMQHNGGGFDRLLRNFIDNPPLLGALRLVFENAPVFGSHVWSGAVNILSSFIHNEPTSYQVIAEAGLSKSFLEAVMHQTLEVPEKPESPHEEQAGESIEAIPTPAAAASSERRPRVHELVREENVGLARGILPATEAIGCIPQAFGAICLNAGGLELFQASDALESFFEIFESPEHVKCMKNDANLLRVLGGSFDELVRHHPALKSAVMSAVLVMVARVNLLCKSKAWESGLGTKLWAEGKDGKQSVTGGVSSLLGEIGAEFKEDAGQDQLMSVPDVKDADLPSGNKLANGSSGQPSGPRFDTPDEKEQDKHGLIVANYIYPVMKFLGAFFDNQTICTYFIEAGGVEFVLDYATLQSLPFDFHNNPACPELAQVIHLMAETKPHLVLPSLVNRTQAAVDRLEQFWGESRSTGFFSSLTSPESSSEPTIGANGISRKGTYFAKHLVTVHTLMDILREVFTPPIYPTRPSQQVSPFIQVNMADMYTSLARRLGLLHASCVWEEILLQKGMPESWNEATKGQSGDNKGSEPSGAAQIPSAPESSGLVDTATVNQAVPASAVGAASQSSGPEASTSSTTNRENSAAFKNVQTLRYLLSSLPLSITEFLHILGHSLVSKRRMDSYQRQSASMVADAIASTVLEQLDLDAAKETECSQDRFSYLIVILSSFSKLLFETTAERPHAHCLTMVLFSFKRLGGFQVIKGLFELFLNEIKELGPQAQKEGEPQGAPARRASAYGAIKIILTFFAEITSASYIMNSSQTQSMTSSERDRDRPDYFVPAQFLLELRMEVLPVVRRMWGSEFIDQSSSSIVKSLIEILRSILESEHEGGAFKRSDTPPALTALNKKPFHILRDRYASLKEKSYEKSLAREALYRCNNNLVAAEEYCKAQSGLRAPPRVPMPSNELESSPTSGGTPQTTIPSTSSAQAPGGEASSSNQFREDAIASLLGGAIRATQGEESQAEPSTGDPEQGNDSAPDNGPNSSSHLAMSIDNLLNDQEGSRSQEQGSSSEQGPKTTHTVPTPKPEQPKRREVVTIEDLDSGRDEIRADLIECCLDVLNVHHDVTFELSDLILAASKKLDSAFSFRKEVGETLVQSLISLQMEENFELVGKKIAAYANLLALVLQDKSIYDVTLEELKENFSTLLGFIKVSSAVPSDKLSEPSSPWVGQVLLILEKVLSDDAQPKLISWNPPSLDDSNIDEPISDLPDPVVPMDEKKRLFEAIVDVLPRIGKDTSLALSISRVLVILTRHRDIAAQLGEKKNLQRLFVMMKQLSGSATEKLQSTFMLILRHIVEDEETIRQIMRTEIVAVFESRPTRHTDTAAYIRQLYHLALRSPELFVEVTNEKLKLTRYETHQRPQGLMLKSENKEESSQDLAEKEPKDAGKEEGEVALAEANNKEAKEKQKGPELKTPIVENPDGVIHYLLSELLSYKDVDDKEPTGDATDKAAGQPDTQGDIEMSSGETTVASSSSNLPSSRPKKSDKPQFKAEEHPIYIYRCFLLQCLTELLSSYNRTKVEFINFSRKADPLAATPSKPRSGILNYLLNAVIPVGTLEHDESIVFKKRSKTSDWAMQVVVALCNKTGEFGGTNPRRRNAPEEDEPELLFIRKFVLEHALKSYKDANASNEALDVKYARLMSLADLFDKMLSGGTTPDGPAHGPASTKQVAKTMFEKNFISAFTASIADIDINFPSAKRAVKYILRPLNKLTQTAVVLSESSSIQTTPGQTDEDEISSATSVSDVEDEREETPDLFRHSTLGMFDPNQEEETSSEESENEDDDEMYDDEYGDDMDYEEELPENDGEVVSDEDEEIDGPGPIEGLPGDSGMDIEVLIEGDEDGGEDEDDEEDDDDEDENDEDDDTELEEDEIMAGEITNPDTLEDDWESEDMSEDGDEGDMMHQLENEFEGMPHGGPHNDRPRFENLLRVLEDASGDIEHIEDDMGMGGGLQGDLIEDEINEDEDEEEDVDELEEELDDLDDDEVSYHGFDDDDPDLGNPPWGWQGQDPIAPRGHHHRFRGVPPPPWSIGVPHRHGVVPIPPYRSQRAQIPRGGADDGTNPLLIRNDRPGDAAGRGRGANTEAFSDWVHAIDPSAQGRLLSVDSPVSFMNAIMQAMGQGGAGFGVVSRPDGFHVHLDRRSVLPNRLQDLFGLGGPQTAAQTSRDDPSQVVTFAYGSTISRWQEETRLLFGNTYHEKTQRIHNSLLRVLVPPAIEEEKVRRKELEEEQKRREEEQAERERIAKEEAEKERKRKEEEEAALERQRELERQAEAEAQPEPSEQPSGGAEPMEDVQTTEPSTEAPASGGEASESGPSEPAARVRTTIRGRQLDITGMDIDPEYLEALPEEIREEVIMQQLAQQRTQAAASGEEPSEINPEFLEALPPEIREELLQQEAADRRRRERETARRQAATTDSPAHAEDMDPASFIATLDPSLRQAVLADQPEEILASLGPEYVSEARALTGRRVPQFNGVGGGLDPRARTEGTPRDQAAKKPQRKQIVQMLDKAGVATLLRLMFMPLQGNARHHLNDILHNVCANRQTRAEVVGLLLLILQDGSADVSAIERSFAHLSLRAKTPASQKTPQPLKRTLSLQSTPGANSDVTPLMVVHQCLVTLSFLTQHNPHIAWFFLSEHDTSSALKLRAFRKGKGKENRANKFALNALLSLLDRKLIMESPNCMEQLSSLLASITQPLTMLLRKEKEKQQEEPEPKEGESSSAATTTEGQSAPAAGATSGEVTTTSDTTMTDAPETRPEDQSAEAPSGQAEEGAGEGQASSSKPEDEEKSKKSRTIEPPVVPEHNLRLVVHILSARECNGKTFRETLSTINNLSAIPGAKETIGRELINQAQGLSKSILVDLDDLLPHIHNAQTGTDVQGMALSNFAPASSDQSKLLRVLTALDYLFDPNRADKDKAAEPQSSDAKEEVLKSLYESSKFNPLWSKLSECLGAIRKKEKMLNVATILLPLIEALMVVCKNTTLKDVPISRHGRDFAVSSPPPESGMEGLFFNFTEEHRKVLNELVRQNPKLMSGTFSLLVKNPKVLEFDNKRNYFNRRLHSRGAEARHPHPPLQLSVRRDQVFLDSFKSLYFKTADEMKYGKLNIRFHGEEGVDAGGVSREWFQVLARGMFNPNYALFIPVASDRTTFHPNRLSGVNQEHLMFFKFIGRIIGKALYEGRVLDCHFSRAVYKRILGKSVSIKDMETLDLDYYKSLLWMLENDITDIITENFSVETDDFGEKQTIDLIEGGRHIPVTQENKEEYVQLVVEYRLTGSVKEQLDNFLKGFHDIVPAELISIFSEQELELLISGLPEIDVDDWKNNSEYHNYSASSSQIQWFWRAVRSFDKEERAKLLQFVSGTSKVPLNGFKELEGMNGFSKFNIHRDYGNKDRLPSSHTCFNQLDLPEYDSYEVLRERLYTAMTAGGEYFGFA